MKYFVLAALLATLPMTALAHGIAPAAQHGGSVAETTGEHWVELVLRGTEMTVYVSDDANKPIASARLGGKATVLVGGKSQQVALLPAAANSLTGKLDPGAAGKVISAVTLTVDGKSAQVRFTTTQP